MITDSLNQESAASLLASLAMLDEVRKPPTLTSINGGKSKAKPVRPSAAKVPDVIRYEELRERDWTRGGVTHKGKVLKDAKADVIPGVSVRIFGRAHNLVIPCDYDLTFKIGDDAVYDSYNTVYVGKIIRIGEKTVAIQGNSATTQIAYERFTVLNCRFNREKIAKAKAEHYD